jgi:hypothetical protein
MTDDNTIDIGEESEDMPPKKRKTTYNREHPTENPKPPKRSRAEIQAAAAEKRAAAVTKKKEHASLLAAAELKKQEKRRTSLKEVAAMEDAIQRIQSQYQLQAERPNLKTMETYRMVQKAQASLAVANSSTTGEIEEYDTDVEIPPHSMIDTDSDGGLLGVENNDEDDEDEGADMYMPDEGADMYMQDEDDKLEEEDNLAFDESVEQGKTSKKNGAKMQKVRIPVIIYLNLLTSGWLPKG